MRLIRRTKRHDVVDRVGGQVCPLRITLFAIRCSNRFHQWICSNFSTLCICAGSSKYRYRPQRRYLLRLNMSAQQSPNGFQVALLLPKPTTLRQCVFYLHRVQPDKARHSNHLSVVVVPFSLVPASNANGLLSTTPLR